MSSPGLYVEIDIASDVETVWRLTQQPDIHERWDLRFSGISYLPREPLEPQRFLYETKIGFGITIKGGGESTGERTSEGESTSALRFWSDDRRSLISEGTGYWKYIQMAEGVRFFTWYDYRTRFGWLGKVADRLFFRPMMGWATAWSFDRLRLWIEDDTPPEDVLRWSLVYAVCRLAICAVWIWHGTVPKLIFAQADEIHMLTATGLSATLLPAFGALEIVFGLAGILLWRWHGYFAVTAALMLLALTNVAATSPEFLVHAFGPVTLNLSVIALSVVGYLAARSSAFAGRCRRKPAGRK